jgi:ubiquinone/menaquinone biosynthesis C-methylase UbiE
MGEAEALPLPDASIDLAISTISFHHWHDQKAGVREIARVLRPEGYFALADLSYPGWSTPVFRSLRFHSAAQFREIFAGAGLRVQTQQPLAWHAGLATFGQKI